MGFEVPVQIVDHKWCAKWSAPLPIFGVGLDVGLCKDDLELLDCHLASSGYLPPGSNNNCNLFPARSVCSMFKPKVSGY